MKLRMNPHDVGWRIGKAHEPRGGELWVPFDRTAGVIGPRAAARPSTCSLRRSWEHPGLRW